VKLPTKGSKARLLRLKNEVEVRTKARYERIVSKLGIVEGGCTAMGGRFPRRGRMKSVALLSRPARWLLAAALGFCPTLIAARELNEVEPSAFARLALAPVPLIVRLVVPRGPNVGTVERPLYEATPLHSLAALVAVPLCAAMYTLVAYTLLSLLRRRGAKGANETADTASTSST